MVPRETVLLPTFWNEENVGGEDGRKALEWLVGTEAEKQLQRKDGEGLSLVRFACAAQDDTYDRKKYERTTPPLTYHPQVTTPTKAHFQPSYTPTRWSRAEASHWIHITS
jgi:hypothetical protein